LVKVLLTWGIAFPEQHGYSVFGGDGSPVCEQSPVTEVFAVTSSAGLRDTLQITVLHSSCNPAGSSTCIIPFSLCVLRIHKTSVKQINKRVIHVTMSAGVVFYRILTVCIEFNYFYSRNHLCESLDHNTLGVDQHF